MNVFFRTPDPDPAGDSPEGLDTRFRSAVWESLTLDPTIGVSIVTDEAVTLYCNRRQAQIFGGDEATPELFMGKKWSEYFPPEWIEERVRLLEQIKATGKPLVLRTIWHGKQQFSHMRKIDDAEGGGPTRFLIVTRRLPTGAAPTEAPPGHSLHKSDFAELGNLEVLTGRELEVLSLIGQGLTSKEIAKILHRSEKTVENHRYSISKKLQGATAVQLSDIANQAGLELTDAKRTRL